MNPHKPPVCLVSPSLGLQKGTSRDCKEQDLRQGVKENTDMATTQAAKPAGSGLLVFLKGFAIFSTCRIPLRQEGRTNLKFLDFFPF